MTWRGIESHLLDMADLKSSEAPLALVTCPMPLLLCASLRVCVVWIYKYYLYHASPGAVHGWYHLHWLDLCWLEWAGLEEA